MLLCTTLRIQAAAMLFVFGILTTSVSAADKIWANTIGQWDVAGGWIGNSRPANGDNSIAYCDFRDATISFSASNAAYSAPGIGQLFIDGYNGFTMRLEQSGSQMYSSAEVVGYEGSGYWNQTGGTNTAGLLFLGYAGESHGVYSITGASTQLNVGTALILGRDAGSSGDFAQFSGTVSTTQGIWVGNFAGATGAYGIVSGQLNAGSLVVGAEGTGYFTQHDTSNLNISNGIILGFGGSAAGRFFQYGGSTTTSGLWVGNIANTIGEYNFKSGTLNTGSMVVAAGGNGTFNQTGGALTINSDLFIGSGSTGAGTFLNIIGVVNVSGDTRVGYSTGAAGTLVVNNVFNAHGDVIVGPYGFLDLAWHNGFQMDAGGALVLDGGEAIASSKMSVKDTAFQVVNGGYFGTSSGLNIGSSENGTGNGSLLLAGEGSYVGLAPRPSFEPISKWASQPGDQAKILVLDKALLYIEDSIDIARTGGSTSINIAGGAVANFRDSVNVGGAPSSSVRIQLNDGHLILKFASLKSGTTFNIAGGTFNYGALSVQNGASVNFNSGTLAAVDVNSNWILEFFGGIGSFNPSVDLAGRSSLKILQGGSLQSNKAVNLATVLHGGTISVSGAGSGLALGLSGNAADASTWGNVANGGIATVAFSDSGAGTFNAGLKIAPTGLAFVSVGSDATFFVRNALSVGGSVTSVATFTINGGTLTSAGSTAVGRGSDVSLITGGLRLQNTSSIELGATLRWNGGTLELQNTTIGGNVLLSSGNNKVFRATLLDVTSTGKIDLADNPMILDYTGGSPIQSVRQALQRGRLSVPTGITSSYVAADPLHRALAYIEASTLLGVNGGTFANQGVDGTALLVRYTLPGDANLDGAVDAVDLGKVALHWAASGTWIDGDFDYSGSVDVRDLHMLASNWKSKINGVPGAPFGPDLEILLSSLGLPPVSVPEPASVVLLISAFGCLARRRPLARSN